MEAPAMFAGSGDIRLEWPVDRLRVPQGEIDLEIRVVNVAERPVVVELRAFGELSSPNGEPLETSVAYTPTWGHREIGPGESLLVPVLVPALGDVMTPRAQDEIHVEDRVDVSNLELPAGEYLLSARVHGERSTAVPLEVVEAGG